MFYSFEAMELVN